MTTTTGRSSSSLCSCAESRRRESRSPQGSSAPVVDGRSREAAVRWSIFGGLQGTVQRLDDRQPLFRTPAGTTARGSSIDRRPPRSPRRRAASGRRGEPRGRTRGCPSRRRACARCAPSSRHSISRLTRNRRVKRVTKAPRPLGLLRREHSRRVVESELRIVEPRSPEMDIGSQYLHNPSRPAC